MTTFDRFQSCFRPVFFAGVTLCCTGLVPATLANGQAISDCRLTLANTSLARQAPAAACLDNRRVGVFVGGDLLLHRRLQQKGYADGFNSIWGQALPYMRAADVAYLNLETPTAMGMTRGGGRLASSQAVFDDRLYSSFPLFNVHPTLLDDLAAAGVDVVSTANNHALDRGGLGAESTIDALQARGIAFTGTRRTADASSDANANANADTDADANTNANASDAAQSQARWSDAWWAVTPTPLGKIAWIACTYSTNGIPDRRDRVLFCFEQREALLEAVRGLADRRDIAAVMVTPHWGYEYQHQPNARQRALAQDLRDAGATAIVGAHSHVVGPWEVGRQRNGLRMLTIYSMGNFVSGQVGIARLSSLFGWIELCRPDLGDPLLTALSPKLSVAKAGYVPTYMHRASARGPWLEILDENSGGTGGQAFRLVQRIVPDHRAAFKRDCDTGTMGTRDTIAPISTMDPPPLGRSLVEPNTSSRLTPIPRVALQ